MANEWCTFGLLFLVFLMAKSSEAMTVAKQENAGAKILSLLPSAENNVTIKNDNLTTIENDNLTIEIVPSSTLMANDDDDDLLNGTMVIKASSLPNFYITTQIITEAIRDINKNANQSVDSLMTPISGRIFFVKSAPQNGGGEMITAKDSASITMAPGPNNATEQSPTTSQKPGLVLAKWSYEEMAEWGKVSQVCTQGSKQSPIHLTLENAATAKNFASDPLVLKNYDSKTIIPGNLTNNGHMLVWAVDWGQQNAKTPPSMTGSGYGSATFLLDQVSFHWGAENLDGSCKGSEHVVDFTPSPLEVHFVHRNSKYQTFDDASQKSDGLAIISFLFRAVEDNQNSSTTYFDFVNNLPELVKPNATISLGLDFTKLVPSWAMNSKSIFFRYDGSLTMPPCFETVSWTVFQERIVIPISHLQAFRRTLQIKAPAWLNKPWMVMENNYRPIQLRNDRSIWTNGRGLENGSSDITNDLVATAFTFTLVALSRWLIL